MASHGAHGTRYLGATRARMVFRLHKHPGRDFAPKLLAFSARQHERVLGALERKKQGGFLDRTGGVAALYP
jgi:hypothetical protein